MSLDNLFNIANKSVDKAVFEAKIDPMKQMLIATKDLVSSEINRHAEGNENYAVIIKSYGAAQPENAEQQLAREALQEAQQNNPELDAGFRQKEHLYKSIDKAELQNLFARIDSGEDLTPREIQVLSELANSVQKEEFVINLGDRIVCPQESAKSIKYDIENKTAQVAKVQNLGVQRFIGRGEDGQVRVGDRHEVGGAIYNVLDESLEDLDQAFGGQRGVLGANLDDERANIYSTDELAQMGRARRVSYSDEFKKDIQTFNNQYPLSNRVSYSGAKSEPITEEKALQIADSALRSVLNARGDAKEILEAALKWRTLIDNIAKANLKDIRTDERIKDREARLEEEAEERYTTELDEKHLRILMEWAFFSVVIEHLEDPSSLAGRNV